MKLEKRKCENSLCKQEFKVTEKSLQKHCSWFCCEQTTGAWPGGRKPGRLVTVQMTKFFKTGKKKLRLSLLAEDSIL